MAIPIVAHFQQKGLDNHDYPGLFVSFHPFLTQGGALPNVGFVCFAG
jgi:hypothetical protein